MLENDVVIGAVDANLTHYAADEALAAADSEWLGRLITRTVALERAAEASPAGEDDVTVVLDLTRAGASAVAEADLALDHAEIAPCARDRTLPGAI